MPKHLKHIALCSIVITAGCSASAELIQLNIDEPVEQGYRHIQLDVDLSVTADTLSLGRAFIREMKRYEVEVTRKGQHSDESPAVNPGSALLQIEEIERRLEAGEHHKTYGRTSLTQMRGRKQHEKPVISMRATLIDAASGRTVFQADYVAEGPWYADSASVAASLAKTLVIQFEREELIAGDRS